MYHVFVFNFRSGYHHNVITPEAKLKTAFATKRGKWHWKMAPFGICSLPDVFYYLMLQVLPGLDFCFAYLDDILNYSASWKENLQHLEAVFKHLKKENLKIKLSKCQFFKKHLQYLGHLISEQDI